MSEIRNANGRDANGRFVKGNPGGGRPRGIRAKARAACDKYGIEPLEFFASVLVDKKASNRDKLTAATELANRLYGKAVQYSENLNTDVKPDAIKIEFVNTKTDEDNTTR